MTVSKKMTLSADGATATVADATLSDVATTLISTNEALTGTYRLVQDAVKVGIGMVIQNVRVGRGWNIFTSA